MPSGKIALKRRLSDGARALLSFEYVSAGERTRSPEKWAAVRWGALEVRLSAGGMYAEVRENGETRERVRLLPKMDVLERYQLLRDGRALTLYKSGERILNCRAQDMTAGQTLEIEWHDLTYRSEIRGIGCQIG